MLGKNRLLFVGQVIFFIILHVIHPAVFVLIVFQNNFKENVPNQIFF